MVSSKFFLFKMITVLFGFIIAFLFLEIAFRILPVSTPTYSNPVNSENPIANFEPNNDMTSSGGWTFEFLAHKHINNYGFFSDSDYEKQSDSPLMAVIGDSYVEAKQVENVESMAGLLNDSVASSGRVYSLGMSGAPLSQYLAYAGFARKEFAPDSFAFVIIDNDFDESLRKYNDFPSFHYFVEDNGTFTLERIDREEHSLLVRVLRESSVFMFLFVNLKLDWETIVNNLSKFAFWKDDAGNQENTGEYLGTARQNMSEEMEKDSYRAIDAFFSMLPDKTGVASSNIVFVMDGMRHAIYKKVKTTGSYAFNMRKYFMEKAKEFGYGVIDMHEVFQKEYLKNGEKFEFSIDFHWNELGHFLAANEVGNSKAFENTFAGKAELNSRPKGSRY
jgi:hypothetical protein